MRKLTTSKQVLLEDKLRDAIREIAVLEGQIQDLHEECAWLRGRNTELLRVVEAEHTLSIDPAQYTVVLLKKVSDTS